MSVGAGQAQKTVADPAVQLGGMEDEEEWTSEDEEAEWWADGRKGQWYSVPAETDSDSEEDENVAEVEADRLQQIFARQANRVRNPAHRTKVQQRCSHHAPMQDRPLPGVNNGCGNRAGVGGGSARRGTGQAPAPWQQTGHAAQHNR